MTLDLCLKHNTLQLRVSPEIMTRLPDMIHRPSCGQFQAGTGLYLCLCEGSVNLLIIDLNTICFYIPLLQALAFCARVEAHFPAIWQREKYFLRDTMRSVNYLE